MAAVTIPDVAAIAEDAFVLAYPVVLTDRIMSQVPINVLVHDRDTPDTLRSSAWLDLGDEPVLLTVPNTCGRFYALWLEDAWNRLFASLGARITGTTAGVFAVLGPGQHDAPLPPGVKPIAAPTRAVHIGGCIEASGETPGQALERAYAGFAVTPLSRWDRERRPPRAVPAVVEDPVGQVERMAAETFFSEVSRLVADNPPDLAAGAMLERLDEAGARGWPTARLRASLERGVERGRAAVRAEEQQLAGDAVGRWRVWFGRDGADHLARAAAARAGRRLEPSAEVLRAFRDTDEDGHPLSGRSRYVLGFAPDSAPPVHGFWSLSVSGTASPAAHATGDLRGLTVAPDGSLPIFLQARPPARVRRSNWLPTPPGPFSLALRLYWPRAEALRRRWSPPPLVRTA